MSEALQQLEREFARLPGIGGRTAVRLAHYVASKSQGDAPMARDLAQALSRVANEVRLCRLCRNFCSGAHCTLCRDPRRANGQLCVVHGIADLRAIEQSGAFRGVYHVLHGALSPLQGIGPAALDLAALQRRAADFEEVILATATDVDGDATALYIAELLASAGPAVTRIASGVPLGGEIEFLDGATLGRALELRQPMRH
jgi:recombination protein RecR